MQNKDSKKNLTGFNLSESLFSSVLVSDAGVLKVLIEGWSLFVTKTN